MSLLTAGRISRPALARRIADGLEAGSVTLVAGAGFGKTMALEEAVELAGHKSIWLSCGDARGDAGRLLTNAVQGLRTAAPGLVDVVGDALAGSLQQLDVESATSALLAELEHLLVEPLVIVFDDAEALQRNEAAIAMLDRLLGVRGAPLSLAIASRRPLPIRVSKLRAAGRLLEIGPAELSFTASESAELLRERHGGSISEGDVEAVIAASEGWPMGIALARLDGSGGSGGGAAGREDLFGYLTEEVFDHLDPERRLMLADSSVVGVLTPELARHLELPADIAEVAEASGLPMRTRPSGARSYHPLILGFLRERLAELRSEADLASLHERAGDSLASAGQPADAIEHWLEAGRFERALSAMAPDGAGLVRSSPETVSRWLSAMPDEIRADPDYLLLRGQLLWGGGDHEHAVEPLRGAIAAFREAGNADGEWLARVFLADTLVFIGEFEELEPLTDGWEEASGPLAGAASSSVAWYQAIALASLGRIDEAERLKERLRQDSGTARLFGFLDAITSAGTALASGDIEATLRYLTAEIQELEVHDPLGSLPYVMGMLLATRRNLGDRRDALEWVEACEREAERVGLGFALRDFRLQRATLLAQTGDLARAEAVLAQATKRGGTGWRAVFDAEAEAHVATLRGDGNAAIEAAGRALDAATTAPITWRVLTTIEMVELLAQSGAPDPASAAVEATLGWLDERFPGDPGRLPRAWLLASRASLQYRAGEPDAACRTLIEAWDAAGGAAPAMLRARWQTVRPVLWHALAEGAISSEELLPAMQEAFPCRTRPRGAFRSPGARRPARRRPLGPRCETPGRPQSALRTGRGFRRADRRGGNRGAAGAAREPSAPALRAARPLQRSPRRLGARRGELEAADRGARRPVPARAGVESGPRRRAVRSLLGRQAGRHRPSESCRGDLPRPEGARPPRCAGERHRAARADLPAPPRRAGQHRRHAIRIGRPRSPCRSRRGPAHVARACGRSLGGRAAAGGPLCGVVVRVAGAPGRNVLRRPQRADRDVRRVGR